MSTVTDTNEPTFSIGEAAKFFDKSIAWMRWRERTSVFKKEDGSPIEVARTNPRRAEAGQRRYTLENLKDFADGLKRENKLDEDEYDTIVKRIEAFQS